MRIIEAMARGWESKAVEAQMEAAAEEAPASPPRQADASDAELQRKRNGLILSRNRVRQQLENAQNPRYQEMLQVALADLEAQLAALK